MTVKWPKLELETQTGENVKIPKVFGEKDYTILYFYPKDDTPGCTQEACDFRDSFTRLKKKGVQVFGVSPDPVKKHVKFAEKFELPFALLADEKRELIESLELWQEKKFMGRKYMGVVRSTFLIDNKGKVIKEWRNVKVAGHVDEVLNELTKVKS